MPKIGSYDFPNFDLDSTIEKLALAYKTIGDDVMDRENIAETLNMSLRGGGFTYLISDMEKYGLVELSRGQAKITNLGKETIYGSTEEIENAKRNAVSKVALLNDLYSQFGSIMTEEQARAFIRQKTNIDVVKVKKSAELVFKIYKRNANYISGNNQRQEPSVPEDVGESAKSEPLEVSTTPKTRLLKIQFDAVLIQIPADDLKAITMAKDALEFMEQKIRKEQSDKEAR